MRNTYLLEVKKRFYDYTFTVLLGIVALVLLVMLPAFNSSAADTKDVTVTNRYDYAYEVLKLTNAERKTGGLSSLDMDKSLLDSAMLRAAETVVSFSHTRPNGEVCFTANSKMYAENIAWGQTSPKAVMTSWMNSQGHRNNIMNSSYNSIGIGCVEYGGRLYWVQCFGFDEATTVNMPQNTKAKYQVSLSKSNETKLLSEEALEGNNNQNKTEEPVDKTVEKTVETPVVTTKVVTVNTKPGKVKGFKAVSGKKKITFKWKNGANVSGYQLQISSNKKYTSYMIYDFSNGYNKYTVKKYLGKRLKSKRKYYTRIRSYVRNANGVAYSKWTKKTVKVK